MAKAKINNQIEANRIRLISSDGEQLGIVSFSEGLKKAQLLEMDLVLMSEDAKPPVCKILDYKKHNFERKKMLSQVKRNNKRTVLKEVKFRPDTGQGDYEVKLKRLNKFLSAGDRVKVTIRFRGREVVYKERGYELLERIAEQLGDLADVEQKSKLEGKLLVTVFKPVSGKKRKQVDGNNGGNGKGVDNASGANGEMQDKPAAADKSEKPNGEDKQAPATASSGNGKDSPDSPASPAAKEAKPASTDAKPAAKEAKPAKQTLSKSTTPKKSPAKPSK